MRTKWVVMAALGLLGIDSGAFGATLDVHIYDYANLKPGVLAHFLSITRDVLTSAGIAVEVRLCRGAGPIQDCTTDGSRALTVRIVAGYSILAKNVRREPLGESFADVEGGNLASVFVAPAKEGAAAANVQWLPVLAYAAAHEIGHLLLGARAHTSSGLMKESWNRSDYLALDQGHLHFAPEQVKALTARYGKHDEGSASRSTR